MFDQINKYKASFGRLFEAKTLKVMLEIALLTILLSFLGPIKNMYNIDKPQERRKATGTGGIPPENIRLRRTLTTEYLQLSLCYGVRDRMSIETAGFTGWR